MDNRIKSSAFNKSGIAFGWDLFKVIRQKSKCPNIAFSPLSLHLSLGLMYMGAENYIKDELQSALRLDYDKKVTERAFHHVVCKYKNKRNALIANQIFIQDGVEICPEFLETATKSFETGCKNIDFKNKNEAVSAINSWIKKKTKNKIDKIVTEDAITDDAVVLLLSAVHIKANWIQPFIATKGDFYINGAERKEVPTMTMTFKNLKYANFDRQNFSALEIPFKDVDLSMLFIQPNDSSLTLEKLQGRLAGSKLASYRKKMAPAASIRVALPKFQVNLSGNMRKMLMGAGIEKIFEADATFPHMLVEKVKLSPIASVMHKTYLSVDENGVDAESTTDEIVEAPYEAEQHFAVRIPFMFAIMSRKHRLFILGSVTDPTIASNCEVR